MCNPSPRGRCKGDAAKMVSTKVDNFRKAFEDLDSKTEEEHIASGGEAGFVQKQEKLANAIDELSEAKAFLYATPAGQKDTLGTLDTVTKLESVLSPEQRRLLSKREGEPRRVGKFLSKFQTLAREYASENPDGSNIATARHMANGGFISARGKMHEKLEAIHKEAVAEALAGTEDVGFRKASLKAKLDAQHRANVSNLDMAYSYATADAQNAIAKDIKSNSKTFENTIDKHKFGFYKNTDGSFTVRTRFTVDARTLGEAIERSERSFDLEDVQMTVGKPNNGVYQVDTSYVYKGGESIEDAQKFQSAVWKGSPRWRETLEHARRLENFYSEDQ